MSPEPYLDARQAVATVYQGLITPSWLLRLARAGEVPSHRFGAKTIRFLESELRTHVASQQHSARASTGS